MSRRLNLDMDVLRTFVTGVELGSFARAAVRIGRSQSAVSTQLRRLEAQVGRKLLVKSGRGLALTDAGESLLGYAKRLLELNDEAVESLRDADLEGWARLGLAQDFADTWLPSVLKRFSRAHPKVRIEVQVGGSDALVDKVLSGELDLALGWGARESPHAELVEAFPVRWIGPHAWAGGVPRVDRELPFAAFSPPCGFRSAAVTALEDAGVPWRLVFTSASLSGLWAAAEGGLGVTARAVVSLPPTLSILDPAATALPPLPDLPLRLHRADAAPSAAVERLAQIVRSAAGTDAADARLRLRGGAGGAPYALHATAA